MSKPLVPVPAPPRRPLSVLRTLLASEASGGLILVASAAAALVVANSPWAGAYLAALQYDVGGLSVLHWINDALMALFFLLVGLEIKREMVHGQLATWNRRILPGIAALGGMGVPALLYLVVNLGSPATLRGWAIPSATDIAFSLGVLALLSPRVPVSLKVFLTALAILDDLGAIVVIALFYTADLSPVMLGIAAVIVAALAIINWRGVTRLEPYLVLGVALWYVVLQSGIHATIAGVLLAVTIPSMPSDARADREAPPLEQLEHILQPWVAYLVLPIFGFANAGVSLGGVNASSFAHPVTLGCILGLLVGKQVGIFGSIWLAVKLGWAHLPRGANWIQLYGLALLCGIGFTMSLFIGLLAFAGVDEFQNDTKIGVLAGSVASAVLGWLVLRLAPQVPAKLAVGTAH